MTLMAQLVVNTGIIVIIVFYTFITLGYTVFTLSLLKVGQWA